jgi:hypothetical protein
MRFEIDIQETIDAEGNPVMGHNMMITMHDITKFPYFVRETRGGAEYNLRADSLEEAHTKIFEVFKSKFKIEQERNRAQ